jgi:hypothetical protein
MALLKSTSAQCGIALIFLFSRGSRRLLEDGDRREVQLLQGNFDAAAHLQDSGYGQPQLLLSAGGATDDQKANIAAAFPFAKDNTLMEPIPGSFFTKCELSHTWRTANRAICKHW